VTSAPPTTRQLFLQAAETVRTFPLAPADRKPAFALPKVQPEPVEPGSGQVDGLAGDLWDTRSGIAEGRIRVADVASVASKQADLHDRAFGAFEFRADCEALTRSLDSEARSGKLRGPLHGIPISVKDIIDVAGMPTSGSSKALVPRLANEDALAVARLRASGALLVGKAVTHEFALGVTTPQSRSPWDASRIPGGSSGGSAISLVTGMALGSLGTDTRASIRVPAALSGLVGFKPSLDVVPTDRWLTLSWTLDHFAPMARSVRDIALLMDVLAGSPGEYSGLLPGSLVGRHIGYAECTLMGADADVVARFRESLDAMEKAGARIRRLEAPTAEDFVLANAAGMVVSRAEAAHFHAEAGTVLEQCSQEVRDQLQEALGLKATDYVRGLRLRSQLRERLAAAMDGIDALAMPTCKVTAPLRSEAGDYLLVLSENCIPWSFIDFPAISVYMGQANNLPCGLQLVAGPGQDRLLLSVAYGFERVAATPPVWRSE